MTQAEIEALTVTIEQKSRQLEIDVMKDIVRRIKANSDMTSSAEYQIDRLRQLGLSDRYIKEQIQLYLKASDKEMDRIYGSVVKNQYEKFEPIFKETGKEFIPFLENKEMQDLIHATLAKTGNQFKNLTGTMGFAKIVNGKTTFSPVANYFQSTLDNAVIGITTGAFSYDTAIKKTIKELTSSGLRVVDYASNRTYRIDTVARMTVMTGFRQITDKMNEQVAKDLGTDEYEITYHIGARPDHQVWQGTVKTYKELVNSCGLGTVTGLCGANCYHWYEPFVSGVSARNYTDKDLAQMRKAENEPKQYKGKEYTTYTCLQQQRHMELNLRKIRQETALIKESGSELDVVIAQSRYRSAMQQYVEFSKSMNLPEQRDRIYMDGLGRVS